MVVPGSLVTWAVCCTIGRQNLAFVFGVADNNSSICTYDSSAACKRLLLALTSHKQGQTPHRLSDNCSMPALHRVPWLTGASGHFQCTCDAIFTIAIYSGQARAILRKVPSLVATVILAQPLSMVT